MSAQNNGYNPSRPRNLNGTFAYCEELSVKQRDMIFELISNGGNKTEACKSLNIARSTLYDWLGDEKFKEAFRKVSDRIHEECITDVKRELIKLTRCNDKRTALKAIEDCLRLNGYLDTKDNVSEIPQEIRITLADDSGQQ